MELFVTLCAFQESSPIGDEVKTMRMRTRLSIVTLVGAGALLLLIALAVFSAPRDADSLRSGDLIRRWKLI